MRAFSYNGGERLALVKEMVRKPDVTVLRGLAWPFSSPSLSGLSRMQVRFISATVFAIGWLAWNTSARETQTDMPHPACHYPCSDIAEPLKWLCVSVDDDDWSR